VRAAENLAIRDRRGLSLGEEADFAVSHGLAGRAMPRFRAVLTLDLVKSYLHPSTLAGRRSKSRPNEPCGGPRMNPSVDVGSPPRPFRHLRVAKHCTPDRYGSSQAPVHSVLVQKSVTTITNSVGRLSTWMLGNSRQIRKRLDVKSWQLTCPHHSYRGIVPLI
jgi:hypothetical protein